MADVTAPRPYVPAFTGIYSTFEPLALPALRIVTGLILVPHGCQKLFGWFGGAGFEKFTGSSTRWVGSAGILGGVVALTELVGGLMLAFGFLTRFAAAAIAIFMLNAIWSTQPRVFLDPGRPRIFAADPDGRAGVPDPRRRPLFRRPRAGTRTLSALYCRPLPKTLMPGTRPGMTDKTVSSARADDGDEVVATAPGQEPGPLVGIAPVMSSRSTLWNDSAWLNSCERQYEFATGVPQPPPEARQVSTPYRRHCWRR